MLRFFWRSVYAMHVVDGVAAKIVWKSPALTVHLWLQYSLRRQNYATNGCSRFNETLLSRTLCRSVCLRTRVQCVSQKNGAKFGDLYLQGELTKFIQFCCKASEHFLKLCPCLISRVRSCYLAVLKRDYQQLQLPKFGAFFETHCSLLFLA